MSDGRPAGEDGSVLVLVLGFTGLLLLLVAVVANVSVVFLAKRGVASAADGAAISAAQALDVQALHDAGLGEQIPLSAEDARLRVAAYEGRARGQQPGLSLGLRLEGRTAVVAGARRVRLPFRLPGATEVEVSAEARARAPVLP